MAVRVGSAVAQYAYTFVRRDGKKHIDSALIHRDDAQNVVSLVHGRICARSIPFLGFV
ncbi:hypothetical protein BCAR13_940033 [Paraburkholderia caribensis]|nr:hypothetical protein BCAR13_940033 [Paraburkholderia caribensis]